jgi:hypothetical protein
MRLEDGKDEKYPRENIGVQLIGVRITGGASPPNTEMMTTSTSAEV